MLFRSPSDPKESPEEEASFQAALLQTPAERTAAKTSAVEACSTEQLALLRCYREGSMMACAPAREAFWACYKRQRVRAAVRGAALGRAWPNPAPCSPAATGLPTHGHGRRAV